MYQSRRLGLQRTCSSHKTGSVDRAFLIQGLIWIRLSLFASLLRDGVSGPLIFRRAHNARRRAF